jgi:hypothetical protein
VQTKLYYGLIWLKIVNYFWWTSLMLSLNNNICESV